MIIKLKHAPGQPWDILTWNERARKARLLLTALSTATFHLSVAANRANVKVSQTLESYLDPRSETAEMRLSCYWFQRFQAGVSLLSWCQSSKNIEKITYIYASILTGSFKVIYRPFKGGFYVFFMLSPRRNCSCTCREESKRFCCCTLQIKTGGDDIEITKAINMIVPVLSFFTHALNCTQLLEFLERQITHLAK